MDSQQSKNRLAIGLFLAKIPVEVLIYRISPTIAIVDTAITGLLAILFILTRLAQPSQDNAGYQLQIALKYNDGKAGDFIGLPVDYERFEAWCAGVDNGRSLGENHWTGTKGIFSKGEYHVLIDTLKVRGIIRLRGRHYSSGYEVTKKGDALIKELARRYNARLSPADRLYNPNWKNPRVSASERERERSARFTFRL